MDRDFKIGQKVDFLNSVGGGEIVGINIDGTINLIDADGFESKVGKEEIVIRNTSFIDHIKEESISYKSTDFSREFVTKSNKSKGKRQQKEVWEVDLHIHEITNSEIETKGLVLIKIQMDHFQAVLKRAIAENQQQLVIIHGVGEGKLKREILKVLDTIDNCRYKDADILKYGRGATEVFLWSN